MSFLLISENQSAVGNAIQLIKKVSLTGSIIGMTGECKYFRSPSSQFSAFGV